MAESSGQLDLGVLDRLPSESVPLSFFADFPTAIVILDDARRIVFANERAAELMARKGAQALGLSPGEAFSCPNVGKAPEGCGTGPFCAHCGLAVGLADALAGAVSAHDWSVGNPRSARLDQLDFQVWCKPLRTAGVPLMLISIVDVTERRRREQMERIFLHDLMNTAGSLSSLMRLIDPSQPSYGEYFGLARGAADQLVEELVTQRALADAESGELSAQASVASAAELLASVAEVYGRLAETRGIRLDIREPSEPIDLITDPVLLKRVLSNLIKNAVEASSRGDLVSVGCRKSEGRVEFVVANPAAMPPQVRAQLFRRSFSTKGRGRGIGTYAARLFTEDYLDGEILCESGEGKGTVFTVALPAIPSAPPKP